MAEQQVYQEQTGWTGWVVFASVIMIIGGTLNLFWGLVAILNDDWVGWNAETSTAVFVDLTTWGWIQILIGAVVVLAGFGVLTGNILARTIGVIIASLSLIASFFVIPVHPIWAITIIAIDMLVIWALTAHGAEMRVDR
jgi:hypothetical protein